MKVRPYKNWSDMALEIEIAKIEVWLQENAGENCKDTALGKRSILNGMKDEIAFRKGSQT